MADGNEGPNNHGRRRPRHEASSAPQVASPIEDYAIIGDCHTAALVSKTGSIDWLCWPRFDSPACFAALLGSAENGHWRIGPKEPTVRVTRRYWPDTLILETLFETETGSAALIDFMAVEKDSIVRIVEGRTGSVEMTFDLALRFEYGSAVPWVTRLNHDSGILAIAGPNQVVLRSDAKLHGRDMTTVAAFTAEAGERTRFVLTYAASHLPVPHPPDADTALDETDASWSGWSGRCKYKGTYRTQVQRSLLTLKALSYYPTGGIVAAPTTSLPEQLGGNRNWDYRFCWLRDATFTLLALMDAGYYEEARNWRDWLVRAVAGSPSQMQIMYGLGGERDLPERNLPWLPGYEASAPVRVGNAAADQLQLDVYGEVADALHSARKGALGTSEAAWRMECALTGHLERVWSQPDEGLWEVRGPRQHFTHSKVMAWVAFDRAVKAVEIFGLAGPVERWRSLRDRIHDQVCRRAYDPELGTFVQTYGGRELDASLLLMPLVGFLPPQDPRMQGTVAAIQRHLSADGLLLRYNTGASDDGLPPGEGAFLACSF
jgi:GH15 family glucan-1,4-alpha-glucosidase